MLPSALNRALCSGATAIFIPGSILTNSARERERERERERQRERETERERDLRLLEHRGNILEAASSSYLSGNAHD